MPGHQTLPEMLMEPHDALLLLGSAIKDHEGALRRPIAMGFAIEGTGMWVLDTRSPKLLEQGWRDGLDVEIICSRDALSDFAQGRLDLTRTSEDYVFLFGGDTSIFEDLGRAFSGKQSWLEARTKAALEDT